LANEYAPQFKDGAKQDVVQAILNAQFKDVLKPKRSTKLTTDQMRKRQTLITERRGMLLEAKSLRTRKEGSRMHGHCFAFLVEIGWHTECGLPIETMSTCIESLNNEDYKKAPHSYNMGLPLI